MELKWLSSEHMSMRQIVLIVPLWNWNIVTGSMLQKGGAVLIVPLWNWNSKFTLPESLEVKF